LSAPHVPAGLISLPDVERMVGMKRSTIYARMKEGKFPNQVYPSAGCARWRASEIHAFIASLGATQGAK
jgi:prophage regulatory protein